jgi:hypothetical protein
MPLFKKKVDPVSERAKALSAEIAALEAKIKKLDTQVQHEPPGPRLRPAAMPHGAPTHHTPETQNGLATPKPGEGGEPIFEKVDQKELDSQDATSAEHFNELGVRKYDLPALLRRVKNHFRGPTTTNPKLVSYLAAGGVQGLRPMRYEKRVARNRFIFFAAILFLLLLGIVWVFVSHR